MHRQQSFVCLTKSTPCFRRIGDKVDCRKGGWSSSRLERSPNVMTRVSAKYQAYPAMLANIWSHVCMTRGGRGRPRGGERGRGKEQRAESARCKRPWIYEVCKNTSGQTRNSGWRGRVGSTLFSKLEKNLFNIPRQNGCDGGKLRRSTVFAKP